MLRTLLACSALVLTANTAVAGCLSNTDKSVAYCAGLLGMIYENKGGEANAFLSNGYVENIAIPADERCGYAKNQSGQSAREAGMARYEAGKRFYRKNLQQDKPRRVFNEMGKCTELVEALD